MKNNLIVALSLLTLSGSSLVYADERPLGFFITSVGMGNGADLGGLEGADAHCKKLATAVGSGVRLWRAYLSTEEKDKRGISARYRIGNGPWYNAAGILIASNPNDLHLYNRTITLETALDETGKRINGRKDKPNEHDILTGSLDDGMAYFPDDQDHTCNNWTSSDKGSAQVGHHDRHGGGNTSWSSAHASRGCSKADLRKTGGNGYFYCFAAD